MSLNNQDKNEMIMKKKIKQGIKGSFQVKVYSQ